MMWLTNDEEFKEDLNELPEPQREDENIKRFWSMLENQGNTEAIMSLATGDDISTKATLLKRKNSESDVLTPIQS